MKMKTAQQLSLLKREISAICVPNGDKYTWIMSQDRGQDQYHLSVWLTCEKITKVKSEYICELILDKDDEVSSFISIPCSRVLIVEWDDVSDEKEQT